MKEVISIEYLKNLNNALYKILDCSFDGIAIITTDLKHVFWNVGAELITSYSKQEIMGKTCGEAPIHHYDENGIDLCQFGCPALKGLQESNLIQVRMYCNHKNGHRVPLMVHVSSIKDEHGDIIAIMEIFRDISQEEDYHLLQEKFTYTIKKYVSKATYTEVIEHIENDSTHPREAKEREITVLYLDVVSFTAFSEQTSPEEIISLLNELFSLCEVIIEECHGDIDKFIGDAVMATFLDANDAVQAAQKIQFEGLSVLNHQRNQYSKKPIRLRIGMDTGKVLQGNIGSSRRKDLTVIGDSVNTAARIQTLCEPGSIYISSSTFTHLHQEYAQLFSFYDEMSVKGKTGKIKVYKLLKATRHFSR